MAKNSVLILSLCLTQFACSNVERLDTTEVKEEMEGHKIKKVSPAQIMEQVEVLGSRISTDLSGELEKQLKGASGARLEEICQLKNIPLLDSVAKRYNLKVRLLGQPDIGSNKTLYAKEKEVLEAYADIAAQKQTLSSNIQSIGDSLYIYTAPVAAEKGAGKLCFSDNSGFAVWSIILRKADIIKSIKPKK
ncbi:hypothetical protein [Emticicia sp. TH156]|uniref:hypothetical protein n=1 Tax=Emticicia sp. TH156 TaxID=2067454 RepID=UPI000C762E39|nr:hypothetical protein [Emticicia sp. TH156]